MLANYMVMKNLCPPAAGLPKGRLLALALVCGLACPLTAWSVDNSASRSAEASSRWWKGNLHTHSLWSDGDDYPEMIVDWYQRHGYHFLVLSDHNVLAEGERWIEPATLPWGLEGLEKYRARFGDGWVKQREQAGKQLVRLQPLSEFRHLFEQPGRFLLIQGEELTAGLGSIPVHVNATNLRHFIPAQGGSTVFEIMQNNVDAVLEQRAKTGQPMFPHINHPNMGWAITAEDIARLRGERFFEVYNGLGAAVAGNNGDEIRANTDRMWDIILTWRLAEAGGQIIYGLAVDDAHQYHEFEWTKNNPGRGWVMVKADQLTPESIIEAMEDGQFYASTGVELREIKWDDSQISIEIDPESGVEYLTQFIGTRLGYDHRCEPYRDEDDNPLPVTLRYSEEVGEVLAEVRGESAIYPLTGDEIYVRAKIISSKLLENPSEDSEKEVAWTQPIVFRRGVQPFEIVGGPAIPVGSIAAKSTAPPRAIQATRSHTPPTIDGNLADACWQAADPITDWRLKDLEYKAAVQSIGYITYDHSHLYLAVKCIEPDPKRIISSKRPHDANIFSDDVVEFMIDPGRSGETYFQLAVNASGSTFDCVRKQGGVREDDRWNGKWRSAVHIASDHWAVEIAVPFDTLDLPANVASTWGINLCREKASPREMSSTASNGAFNQAGAFLIVHGLNLQGMTDQK